MTRYELVPKKVKEDDFWRNYFYRVGLAKQSFELADRLVGNFGVRPQHFDLRAKHVFTRPGP